jgi:hypothetical protein
MEGFHSSPMQMVSTSVYVCWPIPVLAPSVSYRWATGAVAVGYSAGIGGLLSFQGSWNPTGSQRARTPPADEPR